MGAHDIATALAAARKAIRLYPPEHPTHREALGDLCEAVTDTVDVRPLVLNLRDGRLYEGSEVLTDVSPATRALVEAMEARRVESLTFHMGFSEVDGTGISEVLSLRPSPELQIQAELEARGVRAVTVSELEDNTAKEAEERDRRREGDRALYRQILTALKDIIAERPDKGPIESVGASRVIAVLIERIAEDPDAILALATMLGHGDRSHFHAVSVMLHSLVLGHAIGMSDRSLVALGRSALLHDMGRIGPTAGMETDGAERLDHTTAGALALGPLVDEDCFSMIVAREHHERADGSTMHPFSRIVAIADRYDRLIRPTEGQPLRPDEAAARLFIEAAEGTLDPVLTRLFVGIVGVLPVGSTLRLSDHSIGIVQAPGEDPLRPRIRLVLAADGTELSPSVEVDLRDDERSVVELLTGSYLGLQPADHL